MTDKELIQLLYDTMGKFKVENAKLADRIEKLRKENFELTEKLNEVIEWNKRTKSGRKPKVKPEIREEIRRRYKTEDITYQELAEEYGVTRSAICRIIKEIHKNK